MSSFADYSKCVGAAERIELSRQCFTAWKAVRADRLDKIGRPSKLVAFYDCILDEMVYRIHSDIYGRTLTKYPRDWWEAVKERWFPAWALKRWPVLYNRIDELYPELELPSAGPRVIRVDAWQPEETSEEE